MISQVRTKFGFFPKKKLCFLNKLNFFKIVKDVKFAVECVSNDIIS